MADSKISLLNEKTTPVDADQTNILDSEAANADKRMTMANLRKIVIATAGSENQVATFDANGKLIGTALLTATASAVTIGNASAATVAIGHASGGGLTVTGSATFNGALLSPGTGTNSTKIGNNAAATGTGGIAIGNGAATTIGISIGDQTIGSGVSIGLAGGGTNTRVQVGSGASAGTFRGTSIGGLSSSANDGTSIGYSSSASGAYAFAGGVTVSANHAGGVAIGTNSSGTGAATAAANDFVLGVAAHNYKLPGTIITDLRFRTTTGTKIGTGTDQLIGFWNATPVDQPAAIADATDNPSAITQLNALLASMREVGLIASE